MKAILLLALTVFLGAAQQAAACKCRRNPEAPPEGSEAAIIASLSDSGAVFTGQVVSLQSRLRLLFRIPLYLFLTRGGREISDEEEDRLFRRRVRLKVEQSFAGGAKGEVVLYTGWGGGDCGYGFHRGARYLVDASASDGLLFTTICSDTKPIEKAAAELAILQRIGKAQAVRHPDP